ncbi:hypothetical protein [Acinetobacter lwoffii]|uniref:hypothetical protein n=1 Tax=Acinetobacter lwoffii TaxID=28090 RepID=UPI001D0E6AB6|nr:hypothetical protein [Acinetobacter lwoffii]
MKFSEGGYVESTKEGLIQQMLLASQCIYSNMTEWEAEILGFRKSKKLLGEMNMKDVELKLIEGANQFVLVDAETKQEIGIQSNVSAECSVDGMTIVTATFQIPPKKKTPVMRSSINQKDIELSNQRK